MYRNRKTAIDLIFFYFVNDDSAKDLSPEKWQETKRLNDKLDKQIDKLNDEIRKFVHESMGRG